MIGVDTDPAYHQAVREFFELFKTPWALYEERQNYDVVLTTKSTEAFRYAAQLTILFQTEEDATGEFASTKARKNEGAAVVLYKDWRLPIYGGCATYAKDEGAELVLEATGEAVLKRCKVGEASVVAIGFHLFAEVETLLTIGQPEAFASIPTLDLHIDLVRALILDAGIELIEIPPVPAGYKFIACLTHDVDHPMIAAHRWDHTALGFLFRATFGSARSLLRGRLRWRDLWTNWGAALRLPLVYLGVVKDFWAGFEDRFQGVEGQKRSTFFFIPHKGVPGKAKDGTQRQARAAAYCAAELKSPIEKLLRNGCEVGLHGIDAWCDGVKARSELEGIRRLTGKTDIGVRMHWLYFGPDSSHILESAGAAYDSTVGFNSTVGYRAGTTQAYRPLGCERIIEIPLHAMDTAMFYPSYLHLTQQQGIARLQSMVKFAEHNGGTLTVNWHDRSLAPERLWSESYEALISMMEKSGGWFATATDTANWYRLRRSVEFDGVNALSAKPSASGKSTMESLPGLVLRSHIVSNNHPKVHETSVSVRALLHSTRIEHAIN